MKINCTGVSIFLEFFINSIPRAENFVQHSRHELELRPRLFTFRFHKFYILTLVNKVKQAWAHFGWNDDSRIEFHISNLWQLPHDIVFYRVGGGWRLLNIDLRSDGTCAFARTCNIACFDTCCVYFAVRCIDYEDLCVTTRETASLSRLPNASINRGQFYINNY